MVVCQINHNNSYDWDMFDIKNQEDWVIADKLTITNDGEYGYLTFVNKGKEKLPLLDKVGKYQSVDKLGYYMIRQDKYADKFLKITVVDCDEMDNNYSCYIYYND